MIFLEIFCFLLLFQKLISPRFSNFRAMYTYIRSSVEQFVFGYGFVAIGGPSDVIGVWPISQCI